MTPSSRVRSAVAATWAFRARGEREAEDRFRRLGETLRRLGADDAVQRLVLKAAEDERRHADLCCRLSATYGLRVETSREESRPVGAVGMSARDATLAEMVSLGCVAETLSVAALGAIRDVTLAEDIRAVVHEILKDEIDHAKVGWAHLGAERQRGRGTFLAAFLPDMLAAGIPEDLFRTEDDLENEEALSFGQLSRLRRVDIFRRTLVEVIFPGFEVAGVDTTAARAWFDERDPLGRAERALRAPVGTPPRCWPAGRRDRG
jgi:hypothetical protein